MAVCSLFLVVLGLVLCHRWRGLEKGGESFSYRPISAEVHRLSISETENHQSESLSSSKQQRHFKEKISIQLKIMILVNETDQSIDGKFSLYTSNELEFSLMAFS
jgi:hypothetical protein